MQRVLILTPDDKAKYFHLQEALQFGSTLLRQKKSEDFGREARRSESRITAAIRAIGVVVDDEPLKEDAYGVTVDRRKRRLRDSGGEIRLEQPDYKRLCDYVEATPWLQDMSDQITELQDWMEAAKEAKPVAVETAKEA